MSGSVPLAVFFEPSAEFFPEDALEPVPVFAEEELLPVDPVSLSQLSRNSSVSDFLPEEEAAELLLLFFDAAEGPA